MASRPTSSPDLRGLVAGTFTLRFSTGLTGGLLVYYLASIALAGGSALDPITIGVFSAVFFAAELILSAPFGLLSDRLGSHRVMQVGPLIGAVAVLVTWGNTALSTLAFARWLEGASTAASTPSTLRHLAQATDGVGAVRGVGSSRFEAATIAGLGSGLVAAGPLYAVLGRDAFFLNAVIYLGSWLIFRVLVPAVPAEGAEPVTASAGRRRYASVVRQSGVLVLAPTWIAVNAALGLWMSQSIFELIGKPDPEFTGQLLMGGFGPAQVSAALGVGLVILFGGLAFWGSHLQRLRRSSLIAIGVAGGSIVAVAAGILNHSQGQPAALQALWAAVLGVGLFALAAATPAALALLADLSERFPRQRGSIMGLYSVFLAVGQIGGSLVGGMAARWDGIDGMLVATFALLAIAIVPVARLRRYDEAAGEAASPSPPVGPVDAGPSDPPDPAWPRRGHPPRHRTLGHAVRHRR